MKACKEKKWEREKENLLTQFGAATLQINLGGGL
jgi:hypothetical protein